MRSEKGDEEEEISGEEVFRITEGTTKGCVEVKMATEEAAPPAPPPAEEAPPAVPAEAGAGAGGGEQEEKVEEEQEPAEVLPPACFNLEEHKLKVCGSHLWTEITNILYP